MNVDPRVPPSWNGLPPRQRKKLDDIARVGPWRFPPGERDAPVRPGVFPLVAVAPSTRLVHLAAIDLAAGASVSTHRPFDEEARRAWRTARIAANHAIDVFARPLSDIPAEPSPAFVIGVASDEAQVLQPSPTLDGSSFGLGFLLAMVSHILGRPCRGDVIASACIDENGGVEPVSLLREKLAGISAMAPSITNVLVASAQTDEAKQIVRNLESSINIVGVRDVREAVEQAFDDFAGALVSWTRDHNPDELADRFFRTARGGEDATFRWAPLRTAVDVLLTERRGDLSREAIRRLAYARMTFERHHSNLTSHQEDVSLVDDDGWLASLPAPHRIDVVSGLVQQGSDTGAPGFRRLKALVERYLPAPLECFPSHLKLHGAWGRLVALSGNVVAALDHQKWASEGWLAVEEPQELGRPVSEWYRLLPLADARPQAIVDLDAFVDRAEVRGARNLARNDFVRRGRATALFQTDRVDDAADIFAALYASQIPYIRFSAARWLARLPTHREAAVSLLRTTTSPMAAAFLGLVHLDDAIREARHSALAVALSEIRRVDAFSKVVARIEQAHPDSPAVAVATLFPY